MRFSLSPASLMRLEGVKPSLQAVVKRAIQLTTVDFGVTEGLRTVERQQELVKRGLSQTLRSRHLTGDAVDLVAYIDNRVCWELAIYDEVADAMKLAAQEANVSIRWGGAWQVNDICKWDKTMEAAMNEYIDGCRKRGRRPFLDGPHFELSA